MSETDVPYLAPGCFGSALHFQSTGMVCAACPFASKCEPVHKASLEAMRERLGVKAPVVRARATFKNRVEHSDEETTRLTLPKKVRQLLDRLDNECLDIVGKMKNGVNPFAGVERYRFMQVACHLVMKLEIPVTQKVISAGLIRVMGWAETTADSHARMAIQALMHVGAIDNTDGILSVKK